MRRTLLTIGIVLAVVLPATPATAAAPALSTTTIKDNLDHPWDLAFAEDGRMLVTERAGRVRVYAGNKRGSNLLHTETIPGVRAEGESGLMGIAVTRKAGKNFVFVCASRDTSKGWRNQVLRYTLGSRNRLRFDRIVLGKMRANSIHNGCAVEVGPDGKVWVGMGDANDLSAPQDPGRRNGKILRINTDGSIPDDNPFAGSPVYALGFRNPQGIAFVPGTRRAYAIEHGPDVHDEINRLRSGRNYGWPCYAGRETGGPASSGCGSADDYKAPAWSSGGSTLATSGGVFVQGDNWRGWRGDLFVPTLKESDLRRFELSPRGGTATLKPTLFDGRFGRLRAAVATRRGRALFVTTSNGGGNDRIIRIRPR